MSPIFRRHSLWTEPNKNIDKAKLFDILAASDVVVSVRRLFTERTIFLVARTPNSFNFSLDYN